MMPLTTVKAHQPGLHAIQTHEGKIVGTLRHWSVNWIACATTHAGPEIRICEARTKKEALDKFMTWCQS